jgi:hypothetical protein
MAFDLYDYFDNYTIESIFYVLLIAFIVTIFELYVFKYSLVGEISASLKNNIKKQCSKLPKPLSRNTPIMEQFRTNMDAPINSNPYMVHKNNINEIKKTLLDNIDYKTKQGIVNAVVNHPKYKQKLNNIKLYKEPEAITMSTDISILCMIYLVPLYILYTSLRERGFRLRMNSNAYLFIVSVVYLIAYQIYFRNNVAKKEGVYKYGSMAKAILKKRLIDIQNKGEL